MGNLGKFIIFAVIGLAVVAIVAIVSPHWMPTEDPYGLQRSLLFVFSKSILACVALIGAAMGLDWITKGDWWNELEKGNMSVAVATSGAFIGLGLALYGAV